jgi:uncharacterized membrane protein
MTAYQQGSNRSVPGPYHRYAQTRSSVLARNHGSALLFLQRLLYYGLSLAQQTLPKVVRYTIRITACR